ncbi:hypothetical protein AB0E77_02155 [Streptomyces sp. NPDC032940]|uniref:hypothetical protein n=1 Tax=Streptomyces sp. NPDC032940 TaxID=3155366 RepID=UPI00340A3123
MTGRMPSRRRKAALVLGLALLAVSCGSREKPERPEQICGTPVDWKLVDPLADFPEGVHEYSRVDRSELVSAPCVLSSGDERMMEFHFYWTSDTPGFAQRSKFDPVFTDVVEWRKANIGDEAIVGRNGAIASTSCKTARGNHFTLKLHLPQASILDEGNRAEVDAFMRAYFPATVKTLKCG